VVLVGISKWPYAAVAAALEVIPRTLAQVSYITIVCCLPAVPVHSGPPMKSVHVLSKKAPVVVVLTYFSGDLLTLCVCNACCDPYRTAAPT
jgi:hypothetical protein